MFDFSAKIPSITNFANKCDFLKIIRENERVKILALRNISSGSTKVMNLAVNHCLHFCLERMRRRIIKILVTVEEKEVKMFVILRNGHR